MIHPSINLPQLTAQLESIGFEARTKLLFRRGFVDVLIVNGLVPDKLTDEEMEKFAPYLRITTTAKNYGIEGHFNCPIEGFTVLEFG